MVSRSRQSLRCRASFGALLLGLMLADASAQTTPTSAKVAAKSNHGPDARALFEQGRAHAAAERWVEALESFQASLAQTERPSTLFNIAAALVRLGRAREALETLERFERLADPRKDAALRADAAELRRTAESSQWRVVLHLNPPDARVEVDGRVNESESAGPQRLLILDPGAHSLTVSRSGFAPERLALSPGEARREVDLRPLDGFLVVESNVKQATITLDSESLGVGRVDRSVPPGQYRLTLRAPGYRDFAREVDVPPGERVQVSATLEPLPRDESLLRKPLFWGAVAGGVAAIAVGAVLLSSSTEPYYGGNVGVVLAPLRQP